MRFLRCFRRFSAASTHGGVYGFATIVANCHSLRNLGGHCGNHRPEEFGRACSCFFACHQAHCL